MSKTKVICFIGPDGSGKSTLAKNLLEEARKRYGRVSYLWWFEGENSLIRKMLRKFGKTSKKTNSAEKTIMGTKKRSKLVQAIYPNLCASRLLSGLDSRTDFAKTFRKVGCYDFRRFIYDPVIFMSEEFGYDVEKIREKCLEFAAIYSKTRCFFHNRRTCRSFYTSRKKHEIDSIKSAEKMLMAYKSV
jgi:energy-coupling factor transporter ATP-binding protein EcfA2